MNRHMTNAQKLQIIKCLNEGITEIAEIQTRVFVHEDRIQEVIDVYEADAPAEEAKEAPARPRRGKKVDPVS